MFDAHLCRTSTADLTEAVAKFNPDMTVATTAPSYLFWRCAPPELRIPREFFASLGERGGRRVAIGPHGSVTPETTLRKLDVDVVVRGECEEIVAALANAATLGEVPRSHFATDQEFASPAARRPLASQICRRFVGPTNGSLVTPITIIGLTPRPRVPGRRSKPRAAARTRAVSARRSTIATSTVGACSPRCWKRSML